jgi:thioesterase domain-containing protein
VAEDEHLQRFSELQRQAALEYSPEPTDVPIVLFRSEVLQTGLFRDPALGWGSLARGGLTLYEMAGDHDAMFSQPVVEELAKVLTECLRRAVTHSTDARQR